MSSDLVDPSAIFIPKVEPDALEEAADDIRTQGGKISQSGQDIKSSWAGLASCYSAPEDGTLLSVVDPVAEKGDDVDSDLAEVATALETFAETARDLQVKLEVAKQDAQNFVDSVKGDESWDDVGLFEGTNPKVEEHNALLDRIATWTHQYQEAERECANKITSLFGGGTTFIGAGADGSTEPGAGEKVYGTKKPLTEGPTPWGTPQGPDLPWATEMVLGSGDTAIGAVEGFGAQIGVHTEQGWGVSSAPEWGGNLASYWGDSLAGMGAMVGAWNPNTGTWTANGEELEVAKTTWANAAHGFFPWTELEERPGYAWGTLGANVGYMAGGAALAFVPMAGPYLSAGVVGSRVSRILGGAGNGPFGGGGHGGGDGSDGSGYDGNGSRLPASLPDAASGDGPQPPNKVAPDGGFDLSDIGDMNESLGDLEAGQRPAPRWRPEPAPDYTPDPDPAQDAPTRPTPVPDQDQAPESVPEQQEAPEPKSNPEQPSEQDPSRLDPTAEEVDENFAEMARRNEDLGNTLDAEDGGRMAELDGEDPWSIEALKDPEGDGGRGGPDEGAQVPVTPDGMEMSHKEPGDGDEGSGGDPSYPNQTENIGRVEVAENQPDQSGDPSGGGSGMGGNSEFRSGEIDLTELDSDEPSELDGREGGDKPRVTVPPGSDLIPDSGSRFGDGFELNPNTQYEIVNSQGDIKHRFITDRNGDIREIYTSSDRVNAQNPELLRPRPNAKYVVDDRYTYLTDEYSRTEHVSGTLTLDSNVRNNEQPIIGREGGEYYEELNEIAIREFETEHGRPPDPGELDLYTSEPWNGGHLVGSSEYGGAGERLNITPMLEIVNQSRKIFPGTDGSFRNLEKYWVKLLKENPGIKVDFAVDSLFDYDLKPTPSGRTAPPIAISVRWSVDGGPIQRRLFPNMP